MVIDLFRLTGQRIAAMGVVRLRTRDGIERISVPDDANVGGLREAISEHINRPAQQFIMSMDQSLVCYMILSMHLIL